MCWEINRLAFTVALIFNVLCVRVLCASVAMMSPSPQLEQVKEESVLKMGAVSGVQQLVELNFLVGVASLGVYYENRTQCGHELEIMLNSIARHEVWSLKANSTLLSNNVQHITAIRECFLDSFGSPPKTFTWGNYFWFGTPDLCDDLNHPFVISLSHSQPPIFNATSPFPVQFIVVYLNFTTPFYIDIKLPFENLIHLGLCLPKSCSVAKITSYTDEYFQREYFQMQRNFKLKMKALDAKAPHFSWMYFMKTGTLLFIMVLVITTLLGIVSDVVHKRQQNFKLQHSTHTKTQLEAKTCRTATTSNIINHHNPTNEYESKESSIWQKLLMCFRFSLNYETVISLENSNSKFVTVMAGLRTIICLWITVFHVYYYSLFAISNTPFIFAKLETFALQPVLQACFYVDVFFVMSSFLLVTNFLANPKLIQQIEKASWWGMTKLFLRSLLQRYMRLTPVMIVTILLSTTVLEFLNMYSPFRLAANSGFYCKSNWWYNLLYIHNLLDMNDICCSWTWYLACEMQYFILFTGLLYVHVKKPIAAKIAFVTLALGFVVVGWMCNFTSGITFEIDVIYSTLNQLYVKPWVRIPPYLGGAAMGWLMHTLQQQQHHVQRSERQQEQLQQTEQQDEHRQAGVIIEAHHHHHHHHHPQKQQHIHNHNRNRNHNHHHHLHQRQHQHQHEHVRRLGRKAFWFVCLVLYVTTNFMSYWRSTPIWVVATIMSMGKLFFALCIGGVIILCACGRGGYLNVLLSARPFLFLNKFCFSIYMLAPVVVVALFGLRNEPTNFTEVGSGADFFTVIVLSIMSAFLMLMLIELPMQRIANVWLKQKKT